MVLWSFLAVSLGKAPHLSEPVSSLVKWLSDNKPTLLVCYEDLVEHLEQWWVQEECSVNGRGDHDLSPGLPRWWCFNKVLCSGSQECVVQEWGFSGPPGTSKPTPPCPKGHWQAWPAILRVPFWRSDDIHKNFWNQGLCRWAEPNRSSQSLCSLDPWTWRRRSRQPDSRRVTGPFTHLLPACELT